jgi:hypothetical protein
MIKIIEKTLDLTTGEETIIERDETAEEIAEREAREAELATLRAEAEAKAAARQAILDRLGLSADEAALLLGAN